MWINNPSTIKYVLLLPQLERFNILISASALLVHNSVNCGDQMRDVIVLGLKKTHC